MSSWLDQIPSHERKKIREKYNMSAAAYEQLRQRVRGPEDLKEELAWNDVLAQLKFGLEAEPHMKEALKNQIEQDLKNGGIETVLQQEDISQAVEAMLKSGNFDIIIDTPPNTNQDQLILIPEGNVSEKLPVKMSLADQYVTQLFA